ncbi:MAG TPA: JDVT-CTERM system glutamic-type intramembrane protease [Caldimonas sp.]
MRSIASTSVGLEALVATRWLAAAAAGVVVLGSWAVAAGADVQRVWVLLALAPLAEEAVFRAGLQETLLRRWNAPALANATTALAFGLAHAWMQGSAVAFGVAVPALLVGAVYGRWRRLRFCVALHAVLNAVWIGWAVIAPAKGLGF